MSSTEDGFGEAELRHVRSRFGRSGDEGELTVKQRRIVDYIRDRMDTQTYFKSREIGRALGLSTKEVGANIGQIRERGVGPTIEPWGYSSGTTWQVIE